MPSCKMKQANEGAHIKMVLGAVVVTVTFYLNTRDIPDCHKAIPFNQ